MPSDMKQVKKVLSTDNFIPQEQEYELNPYLGVNSEASHARLTYAEVY